MRNTPTFLHSLRALALVVLALGSSSPGEQSASSPIQFVLKKLPFHLESSETPARNAPESMAGGVAVFDYNGDGRPALTLRP